MTIAQQIKKPFELTCGKFLLRLSERTHLMGVLNRTPDSFSDGGCFMDLDRACGHARKMVREGADIIDIGGESTRPGSRSVEVSEELKRTIPVIRKVSKDLGVPISIDTSKSEVAEEAMLAGASIVNDITGFKLDPGVAGVIAKHGACVSVMHMKGSPGNMQDNPVYADLMAEIVDSLAESVRFALEAGIAPDKIIVDPGIGFGKTLEHNLTIIKELAALKVLEKPILIGISRKSFIGKLLDRDTEDRLMGTAASSVLAITRGANIMRVHDVRETSDAVRMAEAIIKRG